MKIGFFYSKIEIPRKLSNVTRKTFRIFILQIKVGFIINFFVRKQNKNKNFAKIIINYGIIGYKLSKRLKINSIFAENGLMPKFL